MESKEEQIEEVTESICRSEKEIKNGYPYIDYFRIVAAILVIAIHVSPFLNMYPPLDFFITRVVGRIAVPFFFMITGYFFFLTERSTSYLKKTVVSLLQIYGIAILIYIPINILRGDFTGITITTLLEDIIFNGTIYHLWYLPAAIIGIVITFMLINYVPIKLSLVICSILYLIGLGGDSYYYIVSQIGVVSHIYTWIFTWSEYTRNGIFMAPIFIYLGFIIPKFKIRKQASIVVTVSSFIIMWIEAILIHHWLIYRHDSMYLLLPVVVYFLIVWLLNYKGKRNRMVKDISLYMYIMHPFVIVGVHSISQLLGLQAILFDQQLIQFTIVTIITIAISYGMYQLKNRGLYKWKRQTGG